MSRTVIAFLADVVGSRQIPPKKRAKLQADLDRLMAQINAQYRRAIISRFVVTLGDEFQGLVQRADDVPDIIQDIREGLGRTRVRIVVSRGLLSTPVKKTAVGSDGPVWYAARDAMGSMHRSKQYGTVFLGFDEVTDSVSTALMGLLTYQWTKLRDSQRETVAALRHTKHDKWEVAEKFGITQQALSNRTRSSGLREYVAALDALRNLLRDNRARGNRSK